MCVLDRTLCIHFNAGRSVDRKIVGGYFLYLQSKVSYSPLLIYRIIGLNRFVKIIATRYYLEKTPRATPQNRSTYTNV